jgi:NAD(P)H-dependent FMN reductase
MAGGLRSVQALRPIFTELHAVPVREQVSFHNAASLFDANGELKDATGANGAAKTLLDNLSWWAQALSEARKVRPYGV